MRALESGELAPSDPSLRHHLDACLGCRGCEPACPSGVGYGQALETARAEMAAVNGLPWMLRAGLGVFRHEWLWRPVLTGARWFSATGLPRRMAGWGRLGFGMGMVSGSAGQRVSGTATPPEGGKPWRPDRASLTESPQAASADSGSHVRKNTFTGSPNSVGARNQRTRFPADPLTIAIFSG
jgi:glycolate oxidase iron-sulfur subunit